MRVKTSASSQETAALQGDTRSARSRSVESGKRLRNFYGFEHVGLKICLANMRQM